MSYVIILLFIDGNIIYFDTLVGDIQPYYYKFKFK